MTGRGQACCSKVWPKKIETNQLDGDASEHIVLWTDPKTGLQVRVRALEFASSPVVEWTDISRIRKVDAPLLEYVQVLDASFAVTGEGIPTILYSKDAASWIPMRCRKNL